MKIAYIYPGCNNQYLHVVNELCQFEGVEVHYVAGTIVEEKFHKNVKTHKIDEVAFGTSLPNVKLGLELPVPTYYKGLQEKLEEIKPDVILVCGIYRLYFWQVLKYVRKYPTKLFLVTELKAYAEQWWKRMATDGLISRLNANHNFIDGVFVYSSAGKQFLQPKMPMISVRVVPSAVNTRLYYPKKDRKYMERGVLKMLVVARMVPFKRYFDLLDAMKELKDEGFTDCTLDIRGDGLLEEKVRAKVKEYELDNVKFLPKVPYEKMRDLFCDYDVLVLPSRNEAIGIVVAEAMACGTATITSDSVGANEFVREGETGLVFRTGNSHSLGSQILHMAVEKCAERFGKKASRVIKEHYTAEIIARKLYKEVY